MSSPSQILELGKAMDGETTSQILEGLARADAAARAETEESVRESLTELRTEREERTDSAVCK